MEKVNRFKMLSRLFFRMCTGLIFMVSFSCKQNRIPDYFVELQSEKLHSDSTVLWTQFGPGSAGYCEIIEYHPSRPDQVIMSPDMYNSYISEDNGSGWQTINDCDGTSLGLRRLRDISFSSQNPEYGLAVDERGWLWVTHDSGRSWERDHNFPARGVCSVIAFDPFDDRMIYAGSGNFWNVKWNWRTLESPHRMKPVPAELDRVNCTFDITLQQNYQDLREQDRSCDFDPGHYSRTDYSKISLTEYGKVWRSIDGGKSWKLINAGLPGELDVGKILFHPREPGTLYMATNYGLYKSNNRGEQWINIGTKLPHNMLRDLALYFDKVQNKLVLIVIDQVFWEDDHNGGIASTGGVYRSIDEGKSWESLNSNLYLDLSQMCDYVAGSYYGAISRWFDLSVEETKARYPKLPQRALQNFNRLLLDPSDPGRMYLGHSAAHDISFSAGDIWKTENGGKNWIMCNRTGPEWQGVDKNFWEKRGNPVSPNMHFAHLQRQSDESPYGGKMGCRALTINSRGDLIAVMEQQTLRSLDHGDTWQQIDAVETVPGNGCWAGTGCSNLTRPRYYMDERLDGNYFLLSGEHGLWQICCDGGSAGKAGSFLQAVPAVRQVVGQATEPDGPRSISTLAIHPDDPNTMFMQMYRQQHAGYIRKTTDGGKSWENISQPVKFTIAVATGRVNTNSLIIDKDQPDNMYFCVPSWDKMTDKKQTPGFRDFGVYRSDDAGLSWSIVNEGLPTEANVNQLCFDPSDRQVIYAGLLKSADLKTKGGLYRTEDRGGSWNALPIPEEIESVNHLFIDKETGNLYIACGTSDGIPESGGVWLSTNRGQSWRKIFHMPLAYQVDVASYDPDRIAVSVGENNQAGPVNPGAYLSFDRGRSWHKSNQGLGQPYWICDLRFDLTDPAVIWCGLNGSGWYQGVINFTNTHPFPGDQ